MKILRGSIIIYSYYLLGTFLSDIISPFIVIPASIIGMLLLFLSLLVGLVKDHWLTPITTFFLKHMGFFFIPLGVSIMASYSLIQSIWLEITIILLVTTALVMGITAKVTDYLIKRGGHDGNHL